MSIIMVMWLASAAFAVLLLLVVTKMQRFERVGSELGAGLLLASLPFAIISFTDLPLMLLAASAHVWLLVLPTRHITGRLAHEFLVQSTRSNAILGLLILVLLAVVQVWRPVQLGELALVIILAASVCLGIYFLGQLWWNTRRYAMASQPSLALKDTPTVSVCVPARNEDHALAECMAAVLASDYPKLEALVLDDCSQDTTSSIIKSFAHDGVRFIQGEAPAEGWLGKNQALSALAQEASGDYLLFMDVDTHVGPQSISNMVRYARSTDLKMLSILPTSRLGVTTATVFGTLEYFWRLVLPITRSRMPVSSKCWLIAAESLRDLGGFASVSRKIVPEESFARRLATTKNYRFLVANAALPITTAKRWHSLIETSLRLSYPRLRRQPMVAYATSLGLVGLFFAPFAIAAFSLASQSTSIITWLSIAASVLFVFDYYFVLKRAQPKSWLLAGIMWPFAVLQETAIFIISMLQYEFGDVNWKGRNVCYPVVALTPQQNLRRILNRR